MTTVALVDDQTLIRSGLRGILEGGHITVVGEAGDGRAAIDLVRALRPDVVLMDLRMPLMDGIEAIRQLRGDPSLAHVRILVLTTHDRDPDVVGALAAGADGFLSKTSDPDELVEAIEATARGEVSLSQHAQRSIMHYLEEHVAPPPDPVLARRISELTSRERDIVRAAADGKDNLEIARDLVISPFTVKTHLNRAMRKLDARDRGQLVAIAYKAGLAAGSDR